MVIADPASELVDLVRDLGDPPPDSAPPDVKRRAELVRRRFGLALPPPFAMPGPTAGRDDPIRTATATDGAAIAMVKWRVFGTSYRGGVMPDHFLDNRSVVPPASFWTGRAMVPPTRRHRLSVLGRPGVVLGYADCGPAEAGDDPEATGYADDIGQVYELYVDPLVQRGGAGARLLDAASEWLSESGFERLTLFTLDTNVRAHAFYRSQGWEATGKTRHLDLGIVEFDEVEFARPARPRNRPERP